MVGVMVIFRLNMLHNPQLQIFSISAPQGVLALVIELNVSFSRMNLDQVARILVSSDF